MYEFKLADLGEGMQEAEVVEWLVNIGDHTRIDQTIARVETDKAVVELPAPVAGRVTDIRIQPGQSAKVGEVLVVFETEPSNNGEIAAQGPRPQAGSRAVSAAQPTNPAAPSPQPARPRALAVPAVRKLAFELGLDIEHVPPSSPSGRISPDDVRAFAAKLGAAQAAAPVTAQPASAAPHADPTPTPAPAPAETFPTAVDERQPLTGLRKRIAEHMERSWRIVPHATAFDEIDGTNLVSLRQALNPVAEQRNMHLTYIPLLIKLLIPALKEFPIFNASLDEEKREIIYKRSYHIGIAIDSPEGLLVPVLRDADRLTLLEIAARLATLIEGARKRTLSLPELSGSTFTLNNVGSFGGGSGTPIINYPEVAILAVGRLQERAVVRQGTIVARPIMSLSLSFDHRLIDGALAGRFLSRLRELVENPQQLLLDMR